MAFDNIVRVYDKKMNLLAQFTGKAEGASQEAMRNMMIAPTVHIESNGNSTLTFQMMANCEKWEQIKHPENICVLNDRHYTALAENAFQYADDNGVNIVNVSLVETWYLLDRAYNQAYNCGIYCYAKAHFAGYTDTGAIFTILKSECSNLGNTISQESAWKQVQTWEPTDKAGNKLSYAILTSDEYKPTNWENAPAAVFFVDKYTTNPDSLNIIVEPRVKTHVKQTYDYSESSVYSLKEDMSIKPTDLISVKVNYTSIDDKTSKFVTQDLEVNYTYNKQNSTFTIDFTKQKNETVNAVIAEYEYGDLGEIKQGATCTFVYGAEVIDEHTFIILPKADTKYKLTVNGIPYEDDDVRDGRNVVMPRGSGGYAMWAALKGSEWQLGICDVVDVLFDPETDTGVFNVETDMQSVLYNIQAIQKLYGGILDWDSKNKILNYRAENNINYQAYDDGFNKWTGYEFREGKNLTATPNVTYDNTLITRAYVLGYGNLNIKDVNKGKTYIDDFSFTTDIYEGYLKQELIYDTRDDGGKLQLLYWAKKELAKQCKPRKSIELEVTDIRTTQGHEHEVFDINNVVKVYYTDPYSNTQEVEEQRVITWEYNAFAMWDCSVELGDKTRNLTEVFKLIYNMTLDAPGVDGSGNISAGNITVTKGRENIDVRDPSLADYLELIAQTTTDNSDALAKLAFTTNNMYSQVELFAKYQKQTDELFSQSYAGLKFYADEKSGEAIVEANKHTETVKDGLIETITDTASELRTYADNVSASASLTAQTNAKNYTDGQITTTKAGLEAYTDTEIATLKSYVTGTFHNTITGEINTATAGLVSTATYNAAINDLTAKYNNNTTSIQQVANDLSAQTTIISQNKSSIASLQTFVDDYESKITAVVEKNYGSLGKLGSRFTITDSSIKMFVDDQHTYASYLELSRNTSTGFNKAWLYSDDTVIISAGTGGYDGVIEIGASVLTINNGQNAVFGEPVTFNDKVTVNVQNRAFQMKDGNKTYAFTLDGSIGKPLYWIEVG